MYKKIRYSHYRLTKFHTLWRVTTEVPMDCFLFDIRCFDRFRKQIMATETKNILD